MAVTTPLRTMTMLESLVRHFTSSGFRSQSNSKVV